MYISLNHLSSFHYLNVKYCNMYTSWESDWRDDIALSQYWFYDRNRVHKIDFEDSYSVFEASA